jgi:hypothetical protein
VRPGVGRLGREPGRREEAASRRLGIAYGLGIVGGKGSFYVNMSSNAQNPSAAVQKVGIPSVPPWGKKLPI